MKNRGKKLTALALTIMSVLMLVIGVNKTSVSADSNPASWIMCKFEGGDFLYNAATTDLLPYTFRSKSALSSSDNVETSMMNRMMSIAGFNFREANEAILGRDLNPDVMPESTEGANESAPKVSAFDRFGMAGLKWSSYSGEWKYYYIDGCAEADSVSKTNYGQYYVDRQEPKSTYRQIAGSQDPRSQQFTRGLFADWSSSASDMVANAVFGIAKFIVSLTITIVGLSMTDITVLMGLGVDSSGLSAAGIFTNLFNTIFRGFVLITFGFTAIYMIWNGLIKRQFRLVLSSAIKTVFIFLVAIIMATNPAVWISIPNKVASYGQALVLSSMSSVYSKSSNTSLCASDVGELVPKGIEKKDIAGIDKELTKVSQNMQSAIGCAMWEQMLLRPWVRGQFGVEYEDMAADKINNINSEWVGEPSVPLGGGVVEDNWALFHLSTQTNAHAQLGESNLPQYVTGVNVDWWRVADALSNYHEKDVQVDGDGVGIITYKEQVESNTLEPWEVWVGNHRTHRMGIATLAVLFASIGSMGPLVMGMASAIYGLGITLLMMVSPVFLLMGTWSGKGDGMFRGWLEALLSTVYKRVGVSILLVLSIVFTITSMNLINKIGWVTAFLLLVVVTFVLVKNRDKILSAMTNVNLGGTFDLRRGFNQAAEKEKARAGRASSVVVAGLGGAAAAGKIGDSRVEAFKNAASSQLRNTLYQTELGRHINRELGADYGSIDGIREFCTSCGAQITGRYSTAYIDDNGRYYCQLCGDESGANLYEVSVKDIRNDLDLSEDGSIRDTFATNNNSWLSHKATNAMMDVQKHRDGRVVWDNDKVETMIKFNIKALHEDIVVFKFSKNRMGANAKPPAIPETLEDYLDVALVNEAWTSERYDLVDKMYRQAWTDWHRDFSEVIDNIDEEKAVNFMMEMQNMEPVVNPNEVIEKYAREASDRSKKSKKSVVDMTIKEDELYDGELYKFNDDMELVPLSDEELEKYRSANESEREIPEASKVGEDEVADD